MIITFPFLIHIALHIYLWIIYFMYLKIFRSLILSFTYSPAHNTSQTPTANKHSQSSETHALPPFMICSIVILSEFSAAKTLYSPLEGSFWSLNFRMSWFTRIGFFFGQKVFFQYFSITSATPRGSTGAISARLTPRYFSFLSASA